MGNWPLDEAAGPTYQDVVGNSNAACVGNCPSAVTGQVDGAQAFDGSSTGLDLPAGASFEWAQTGSFTLSLWTKGVSGQTCKSTSEVLIGRDDPGSGLQWWLGCAKTSGAARFQLKDSSGTGITIDGSAINDGNWHHVAAVRDGEAGQTLLYVDGAQVASQSVTYANDFISGMAAVNLGWFNHRTNPGFHYQGIIDEVTSYSNALSPAEISQNYNNGLAGIGCCNSQGTGPAITSTAVTVGTVDEVYQYDVEASGDPAPLYSLSIAPSGMTIDEGSGLINWVPTSAGTYDVTVAASNSVDTATQSFQIVVEAAVPTEEAPQITSTAVTVGSVEVVWESVPTSVSG
jgi:hypothetical protein